MAASGMRTSDAMLLRAFGELLTASARSSLRLRRRPAGYVDADRMRTALLAAVSHDLRTPLAAARAAVSCLRATDIELTAEDHDELLHA